MSEMFNKKHDFNITFGQFKEFFTANPGVDDKELKSVFPIFNMEKIKKWKSIIEGENEMSKKKDKKDEDYPDPYSRKPVKDIPNPKREKVPDEWNEVMV